MVIRPNYIKITFPLVIAVGLWSIGILMPPQPALVNVFLGIAIPALIPLGLLFVLSNTKLYLSDDGVLSLKTFGRKRHSFHIKDVRSIEENYLFPNAFRGFGMGKALYIKYLKPGFNPKEMSLAFNIYKKDDIKKIRSFIERYG